MRDILNDERVCFLFLKGGGSKKTTKQQKKTNTKNHLPVRPCWDSLINVLRLAVKVRQKQMY